MRHLPADEEELDRMPGPALNLVLHLGSIIEWLTVVPGYGPQRTNVSCQRRPNRKRCTGKIMADLDSETGAIVWHCPVCHENGYIYGWQGTMWDRSDEYEELMEPTAGNGEGDENK